MDSSMDRKYRLQSPALDDGPTPDSHVPPQVERSELPEGGHAWWQLTELAARKVQRDEAAREAPIGQCMNRIVCEAKGGQEVKRADL